LKNGEIQRKKIPQQGKIMELVFVRAKLLKKKRKAQFHLPLQRIFVRGKGIFENKVCRGVCGLVE
jgi:hypothetical protein